MAVSNERGAHVAAKQGGGSRPSRRAETILLMFALSLNLGEVFPMEIDDRTDRMRNMISGD